MDELSTGAVAAPTGSAVPWAQQQLFHAVRQALAAVAQDVASGLAETVGISCVWDAMPEAGETRCAVVLELPAFSSTICNAAWLARAIDLENVEAWCGADGHIRVRISPWDTTKEVDQTVLAITKVMHVKLGLHATPAQRTRVAQG